MNETLRLILALTGGMALGIFFFGGLWLTVKKTMRTKHAPLLFAGSSLLRICTTLGGLYFLSRDNWQCLLIAMIGFIAARVVFFRLTKNGGPHEAKS